MAVRMRGVLAGACVALALGAPTARAEPAGTVSAAIAQQGFARLVFDFDDRPDADVRLANSVLVVSFAEPVKLQTGELARGLGELIGVIRRDPDGTALRLSLNKPVRLVSRIAGEKLFVDLLPTSWAGLPPPLPEDVIAALTKEARAGRELRAADARRSAKPDQKLTIDGATHPTFRRLVFNLGGEPQVDYRRSGDRAVVTIDAPYIFDAAATRARLPVEFAGLDGQLKAGKTVISVPAPGPGAIRGFHDDSSFILDIDREATAAPADAHGADAHAPDGHAAAPPPADAGHGLFAAPVPAPAAVSPAKPPQPVAAATPAAHDDHDAHAAAPVTAPALSPADVASHAPAPKAPDPAPTQSAATQRPSLRFEGATMRLTFPYERATPAAVFLRGRTLWALFDDPRPLGLGALVAASKNEIVAGEEVALERGRLARLTLHAAHLVTVALEGQNWVVSIGEDVLQRGSPVDLRAVFDAAGDASVQADLPGLGSVRSLKDPEVGDELTIAAVAGPPRNVERPQNFVEFTALATAQGVALSLTADDVRAVASLDRLAIKRDAGLTVSQASMAPASKSQAAAGDLVLDAEAWRTERAHSFHARENDLLGAAALAELEERPAARLDLARFYLTYDRAADAKAVLDAIVEDGGVSERDPRLAIMRAAADVELDRPSAALGVLAAPSLRLNPEAALWRASAENASGRAGQARNSLKQGEVALESLPPALKSRFVSLAVDLALDAKDGAGATAEFDKLEVLPMVDGVPARELQRARLAETLGQTDAAAAGYAQLAKKIDTRAAADAELRAIELGLKTGALKSEDAIGRLERLTTGWRGDEIEAAALARLIDLYGDSGRWRDAFSTLKVAVEAFPDADRTRALQDQMQGRFTDLFLGAGLDSLPKLDALALFYDFKEMAPSGKRGDELVRRLADKLVEVDLLDQASDLLDYQIEYRLSGAARAQVAARAALVDLMNAKPAKALEVLRRTRQADLPGSLMTTRLRLESRALAETGRTDLALEIADGLEGPDSLKLRAEILWSARRWAEAGEALEATLGSSWRGVAPLDARQRSDAMRAAIALSLAGDGLGVDRLRQKFSPKMADSPQAAGFEVVTAPIQARGDAFREIARSVATSAAFDDFLQEYRKGVGEPTAQQKTASR